MLDRVFSEISATDRPEIYNVNKDIQRPVRMELPEFLSQISDITDNNGEDIVINIKQLGGKGEEETTAMTDTDEIVNQIVAGLTGGAKPKKSKKPQKSKKPKKSKKSKKFNMKEMSRTLAKHVSGLHKQAELKCLSNLPAKDLPISDKSLLAKALKSFFYDRVKTKNPELNGLDRANEMLKLITEEEIKKVLKDNLKIIKEKADIIMKKINERTATTSATASATTSATASKK